MLLQENQISDLITVWSRQRIVRQNQRVSLTIGVVIPHMGSADVDTRKKMAELCKLTLPFPWLES
jgi:hypothetical protein